MRSERHRATLGRRKLYLEAQIAVREGRDLPADWARAEIAAITYALAVLEDADAVGLRRLGHLTLEERARLRVALAGVAVAS